MSTSIWHDSRLTALVVESDTADASRLGHALEELGYSVRSEDETRAAQQVLEEASAPILTLFDVELAGNAMVGLDHADLLGTLLGDAGLAARHAYIIVSRDPEAVAWALGRVLDELAVPIVSARCALDALQEAIAEAFAHVGVSVGVTA